MPKWGNWVDAPLVAPGGALAIAVVDFLVTPEFPAADESQTDDQAACVDDAIAKVLEMPGSTWARRNRVVGDAGAAWLGEVRCDDATFALYWNQRGDGTIVLLLLLRL